MLGPCLSAAGPHSLYNQYLIRFMLQIKFDRKVDRKQIIFIRLFICRTQNMAKRHFCKKILRPLRSSEFLSRNKETKETMPLYNLYKKYYIHRTLWYIGILYIKIEIIKLSSIYKKLLFILFTEL